MSSRILNECGTFCEDAIIRFVPKKHIATGPKDLFYTSICSLGMICGMGKRKLGLPQNLWVYSTLHDAVATMAIVRTV